jgi:hypothetical protein
MLLTPRSIAGFHYHPRMVAIVHLVTLGWITSSILGSLYLIAPMTLRFRLPRHPLDRWAFWAFVIGTIGMTTHFWIDEPRGMAWSAGTVIVGLALVGWRVLAGLVSARLPPEVKIYFYLAFGNLALAAGLGFLLGLDKVRSILPGGSLTNVSAHAHLAALGWVLMVVMGAGYRLLPMLLPAAPPRGRLLWAGALVLELGVLGLVTSLLAHSPLASIFALIVLAGIAIFFSRVVWMLRHRRPPAKTLRRPDYGVRQVFSAFFYLVAATVLGLLLLLGPEGAWLERAPLAYGSLGLLGFFAQMIVGVGSRLLPLHAYLGAPVGESCTRSAPPPHALPSRLLESMVSWLWLIGVPTLCLALALDSMLWIRVSASLLATAVILGLLSQRAILRRAAASA